MINKLLLAALLIITANVSMAEGMDNAILRVDTSNQYMVSAVLRKNDGDATIRLIQTLEKANSKDEAIGILVSQIRKEFPDYSILDSLVTPVPAAKSSCGTWL